MHSHCAWSRDYKKKRAADENLLLTATMTEAVTVEKIKLVSIIHHAVPQAIDILTFKII